MAWHPSPDEIFVFRSDSEPTTRVVLLIPAPEKVPSEIVVDGQRFSLDQEATDQAWMYVRVDNRKRGLDN